MNSEVLVSRKWTRGELAGFIEDCGGIPDDRTIDSLAGKLRIRLERILSELASGIDMVPATEPAASLYRIGVTLPSCDNCGHYDSGICGRYWEKKDRQDWDAALDCGHYFSPLPRGTACRRLRYTDGATGYSAEFPHEIIAIGNGNVSLDALQVVNALRKDPECSGRLDDVWKEIDEKESPEKWELI